MHELRVMAAVELDVLNATYYAQCPALNEISLWKKPTSNWRYVIFVLIEQFLNQHRVFEVGLFWKKSKQGGRWLRIAIEFPGIFKKYSAEFPEVN